MSPSNNSTSTASPEELARLAVESLQQIRIDPQAAATMSRRRFAIIQMNSMIIGILTCLTLLIVTLSRISNLPEFLFGKCGVAQLLIQNLTSSTIEHNCTLPPPTT